MKKSLLSLLCFLQMLISGLSGEEIVVDLGPHGYVRYLLENNIPICIERFTSDMELIYTHSYKFDEKNRLVSEKLIGDLGEVTYQRDPALTIESPYHQEVCELGENGRITRRSLDGIEQEYEYTEDKRLLTKPVRTDLTYDIRGNLIQKGNVHYTYDNKGNLISVQMPGKEVFYTYDRKGRRALKTINGKIEKYLLQGWNEVAVLDEKNDILQLRIPGASGHPDIPKGFQELEFFKTGAPFLNFLKARAVRDRQAFRKFKVGDADAEKTNS